MAWRHSVMVSEINSFVVFIIIIIISVLNKPFLLGPGMQWFQRAGTRVPAPMGDNS